MGNFKPSTPLITHLRRAFFTEKTQSPAQPPAAFAFGLKKSATKTGNRLILTSPFCTVFAAIACSFCFYLFLGARKL